VSYHSQTDLLLASLDGLTSSQMRWEGEQVRRWEEKHSVLCPASVREWYARSDALPILAACSNSDVPLAPEEMVVLGGDRHPLAVFLNENQGCCRWAFRIDGSDDPDVLVKFDEPTWLSCGCTFSEFIHGQVFDWEESWAEDARTLSAEPPSTRTLAWLAERFRAGPISRPYGEEQPRFFDDRVRITIWRNWIWPSEKVEWRLAAKTFADLDRTLEMLQPFYDEEL
jgi:hypothetical protein